MYAPNWKVVGDKRGMHKTKGTSNCTATFIAKTKYFFTSKGQANNDSHSCNKKLTQREV